MLRFGKGSYGLGVGYFRSALAGGAQAVGHMGAILGQPPPWSIPANTESAWWS
jgi:hypothetical protein